MQDSTNSPNIPNYNVNFGTQPEIHRMSRDMNFVSIMIIIYGAIQCLTIIGAVIGVPVIIAALRLKEAAEAFKHYSQTKDEAALMFGFEKQAHTFRILKILIIVSLVFYGILIIAILAIFLPLLTSLTHYNFN